MKIYDNVQALEVIRASVALAEPVVLVGETGTGKTTIVQQLAKERGRHLVRVNLNGQTGIEELIGRFTLAQGSQVWQDGVLVKAMRDGDYIVLDEINCALPEVLFALHPLLDQDKRVLLAEKNGEVVKPHPEFRFFATMNPSEDYSGTKELNQALRSRYIGVVEILPLPLEVEMQLLMAEVGLTEPEAKRLALAADLLRKEKADERILHFCSTRDLIGTARLMKSGVRDRVAIEVGIVNKASAHERKAIWAVLDEAKLSGELDPQDLPLTDTERALKVAQETIKTMEEREEMIKEDAFKLGQDSSGLKEMLDRFYSKLCDPCKAKVKAEYRELDAEAKAHGKKPAPWVPPDLGKSKPKSKAKAKSGDGAEGDSDSEGVDEGKYKPGDKLKMNRNSIDGNGKGSMVKVITLRDDGLPAIVETDGTFGWTDESNGYKGKLDKTGKRKFYDVSMWNPKEDYEQVNPDGTPIVQSQAPVDVPTPKPTASPKRLTMADILRLRKELQSGK